MRFAQLLSLQGRYPRTARAFFTSVPGLFLLALLSATIGYKAIDIIRRERSLARDAKVTEDRIRRAKSEVAELENAIAHAQDPAVIERIAKEQLNLQNPDERVAVIIPSATDTAVGEPQDSFWASLKTFLEGWFR